jgi:CRISPR-associated protein Csd1
MRGAAMILQALHQYYERRNADPDPANHLPAMGLEEKPIPFIIEITNSGELVQMHDTRERDGKRWVARSERVPKGVKKTSGVAANLLWDTVEYVLGADSRGNAARVADQHAAYRARLQALPQPVLQDEGVQAVLRFLDHPRRNRIEREPAWAEALESNAVVTFRLQGDGDLVCQRPAVVAHAVAVNDAGDALATCLVTGDLAPTERLHTSLKGVWGAQSSGANIVSFNLEAFNSYGKEQGLNAPVGQAAAFAYTTALNHLLARDSRNRMQIADASTVFWAEQASDLEQAIPDLFGEPPKDDPDRAVVAVKALYSAIDSGRLASSEGNTRFFVLGLAPNAARISIRFFHRLPLRELAARIRQHFDDLAIVKGPKDAAHLSLFRLLVSCAVLGKAENIAPNLGGAVVDAVLQGPQLPYPAMLLNAAVNRCRAEHEVTYPRAAAIKACLNRSIRQRAQQNPEKEFNEMLDPDNPNAAYRLGRLFAVLERIQEEAAGGPGKLNATIRDRYYGAASSTPVAVFTSLLRLKNAHLKKLKTGRASWFEKTVSEIVSALGDFPPHLALPDQGRFALGYYHQRQDFFVKRNPDSAESAETKETTEGAN